MQRGTMWSGLPLTVILALLLQSHHNGYAIEIVEGSEANNNNQQQADSFFPIPKVENVYKEWKPVDHGHPLRDVTLYYSPPTLERVHILENDKSVSRRRSAGHARSGDSIFENFKNVVIPATPKEVKKATSYSVYGSPDINYSELYSNPDAKNNPAIQKFLAKSRDFEDSEEDLKESESVSRSSQRRRKISRRNFLRRKEVRRQRSQGGGGGFRYVDPPNKSKETEYYYYKPDSPFYNDDKPKLSIKPPVLQKKHEEIERRLDHDSASSDSFRSVSYAVPPPQQKSRDQTRNRDANVVVYSFKNNFGQRQNVGIVYDQREFNHSDRENQGRIQRPVPKIPFTPVGQSPPTRTPLYKEPSHQELVSGNLNYVHHGRPQIIPLKSVETKRQQNYPLGNPYGGQAIRPRPDYFPAQKHPPIYKVRPTKLEGVFGPALPPKPEPTHLNFPHEENDLRQKVSEQRHESRHDDHSIVYKTVRGMDYARPNVIMRVKDSGELYVPDESELNPIMQPESPSPLINTPMEELQKRQKQARIVKQQQEAEQREAQWHPDYSDTLKKKKDSTTQAENDGNSNQAKRHIPGKSQFSFPTKIPEHLSGGVRPFSRLKVTTTTTSSPETPPSSTTLGVTRTKNANAHDDAVTPNYKYVVGASYNRNHNNKPKDDEELNPEPKEGSKRYSPEELYALCIKEVPEYLVEDICSHVLRDAQEKQARAEDNIEDTPIKNRKVLEKEGKEPFDPFKGIVKELPKQTKSRSRPKLSTFTVITNKSKVKVQRNDSDKEEEKNDPPKSQSTTSTTTTSPKIETTSTTTMTTTTTFSTTTFASTKTSIPTSATTTSKTSITSESNQKRPKSDQTDQSSDQESSTKKPVKRIRPPSPFLQGLANFFRQTLKGAAEMKKERTPPSRPIPAEVNRER